MNSSEVISLLKSITMSLETRDALSYRMMHWREVQETDIETLDRLLKELRELREKGDAFDELQERKMDAEDDVRTFQEKLKKANSDLGIDKAIIDTLREDNQRLYTKIQEKNMGGLTPKEWNSLEIALDRYIDFAIEEGFQRVPGLCGLQDLQIKIKGRGEE